MASSDVCNERKQSQGGTEGEEGLMGGIIKGIEDYKAGKVKTFKSKDELLDHLRNL